MTIKKPQANAPVEQVNQLILNILVTKDLSNKVFDYIYPLCETLAYIAYAIGAYYHRTIQATPDQSVFGIDMILNLMSVIYW